MDCIILSGPAVLRACRRDRHAFSGLSWLPTDPDEQSHVLEHCRPSALLDFDDLARLGFWGAGQNERIDCIVGSSDQRRRSRNLPVSFHVLSKPLPPGAIMRVTPHVYCVSPTFAVMQASPSKSMPWTLMQLMELLGSYSLPTEATYPVLEGQQWPPPDKTIELGDTCNPKDVAVEQAHYKCDAAATMDELQTLAEWATSSRYSKFRTAARHAKERSASPGESIMYGVFGLPFRMGGLNLNALDVNGMQLNCKINFDHDALTALGGMDHIVADALIEAARTCFEYNGSGHETPAQTLHDNKRNNGLRTMGYNVYILDRQQMADLAALETIANAVYRHAGERPSHGVKGFRILQGNLLNELRAGAGLAAV